MPRPNVVRARVRGGRTVTAGWTVALGLMVASAAPTQPPSDVTRCDIYRVYICQATGCYDGGSTKAWAIIDWGRKDYAVCDSSACQHRQFQDWPDGIYRSLSFVGTDLMAKINLTDMSLVETGTMLNASVTSFGNCAKDEGPSK